MKLYRYFIVLLLLVTLGCGAVGGTETGTTDPELEPSKIPPRLEATASILIPDIETTEAQTLSALTYGPEEDWDVYLEPGNNRVLTDIFGSADEEPQVVTRIRVLLDQLRNRLTDLFDRDPEITCNDAELLDEGDTIEVAFYGSIPNGTADDRFFDCLQEDGFTQIYGKEGKNKFRVAEMSDLTATNTEDTSVRGNEVRTRSVILATYAEQIENGNRIVYLDLRYNQFTQYPGADGTFGTDDDIEFKSRSRITGRAQVDDNDNASLGAGEFTVTKFDQVLAGGGPDTTELITKTIGRGMYEPGDHSIFDIDANFDELAAIPGNFCISMAEDGSGLPNYADPGNCASFEEAFAWGAIEFPFTIDPALPEDFESKAFFEGNNTDLIADDGSNFVIPSYATQ